MNSLRAVNLPDSVQFESVHSKDEPVSEITLTSFKLQISYDSKSKTQILLKTLV